MNEFQSLPFHLQLLVREYGQSTYQLIQGLRQVEDVAERTRRAAQIVQLILRLKPTLRDQPDIQTRLWSHLSALLGEEVELEAPVALRPVSLRVTRPKPVPYPRQPPRLRAYGRAVEALIAKALTLESPAEREQAAIQIGRTMKFLFRQHNKENAKDATIIRHLSELSNGQLKLDPAMVDQEDLFEMGPGAAPGAGGNASGGSRPPFAAQPSQPRRPAPPSGGNSYGSNSFGNGPKRNKKGGKKGRQEPQQPPQ